MAIGDPGQGEFRDVVVQCRNHDIATGLAPLMLFRSEVVHAEDLLARGGLDTPTRDHFILQLRNCDKWRRHVTYNPEGADLKTLCEAAADVEQEIAAGAKPFGGDDIQMGATHLYQLPWDFSGEDSDIPLGATLNLGDFGRILLLGIDTAIVVWSRLESRNRSHHITKTDSLRVYGLYKRLYRGLMSFGGEENFVDIAQGVLASQEPRGPANAPNRKTETAVSPKT